MTSAGLGEMFEGDSADTCAEKFPDDANVQGTLRQPDQLNNKEY